MKVLINKPIKLLKNSLVFSEKDRKAFKKELGVMRILTSLMSFTFLFFFLSLNKINYETVLSVYTFFTSEIFRTSIVILSAYVFIGSIVLRNFTYVFTICLFLYGQFLFVHVLDDDYAIDSTPRKNYENPSKTKIYYSEFWNLG